jgi:transposase InsO family protein
VTERYGLMHAEKANFKVTMMARVPDVSRSGYYAWQARRLRPGADEWATLRGDVERLWRKSKRRHGARRIHKGLLAEGAKATLYRVRKCMRELGIAGIQPHAKKRTTIPAADAASRPDLIRRDFAAAVPTTKLAGDITYLKTGEGWLYLAVVIDLCTRMVVGWSMEAHMRASLVVSALRMAGQLGYVALNAIFHSDRGSQYTSKECKEFADASGIRLSVGRTGTCHDNAVAESFFSMLKNEMYCQQEFATRAEARSAVMEYIEIDYNRQRRHSTIDCQIPAEKMAAFFERTAEASGGKEGAKSDLVA